jgi:hypothetical protein
MAAETRTRANEVRRYVELDALSDVAKSIVEYVASDEDAAVLREIDWSTMTVDDGSNFPQVCALPDQLWGDDYGTTEDWEVPADWNLASAEAQALQALIFTVLASDGARDEFQRLARHSARIAQELTAKVREGLDGS